MHYFCYLGESLWVVDRYIYFFVFTGDGFVERGSSVVKCRTRKRKSPGSNPFATVSKFGHFRSLHGASVGSAV